MSILFFNPGLFIGDIRLGNNREGNIKIFYRFVYGVITVFGRDGKLEVIIF